jgi:hypothetical protein
MAFDAKQAVIETLTHLSDELKQAKDRQAKNASDDAKAVADLESQIAGWQSLLSGADEKPAKKTAAKK